MVIYAIFAQFFDMELIDGKYLVQGIGLHAIAQEYGTPVYVYDGHKMVSQLHNLKNAFSENPLKIKFAMKSLSNISILKLLHQHGAGIDAVSINEARLALGAGVTGADINFTPNGVDFSEIEEGVDLGLSVNLDNLSALEKFGKKYGASYPCGIRLNPHIMAGGNYKISTGHSNSKFGISIYQLPDVLRLISQYKINVTGLHIHTGSEITETDVFLKMAEILFGIASDFPSLKFIDIGSGFKVAYKEGDHTTNIYDLGLKLGKNFKEFYHRYGRQLELWIEPGKYVVSEAGLLIVKVNVVKPTPSVTFAGVDSGLNHLIRPMMYDAYHEIVNISNPTGSQKIYTVVGNICETDTLGADRKLNEVREGDLLAIKNAGAYGYSMASNYNSRFRPPEVLVWKGKTQLIRKRDTLDDLLRNQVVAEI
ncbi:MAG: Diaminopimelate decarboxylase [Cytophagales bacterium]|jgi:diaminopimelate decarboxylase|nr:MAG: Diaminopimelate decarboxylase [Cytophagales bacterium]